MSRPSTSLFLSEAQNSTHWTNLALECGLSKDAIKGLAFMISCLLHRAGNPGETNESISERFNWFVKMPSPDEMTAYFNPIEAHFFAHKTLEEYAFKFNIELPSDRFDIDGNKSELFKPFNYEKLPAVSLDDYFHDVSGAHFFYEELFKLIGSYIQTGEYFAEEAFLAGISYMYVAAHKDLQAVTRILEAFEKLMPPFFGLFLNVAKSKAAMQTPAEGGYIPFQVALSGALQGRANEICNFVWNGQRDIFYDQKTLKLQNEGFQWLPPEKYIDRCFEYAKKWVDTDAAYSSRLKRFLEPSNIYPNSNVAPEKFIVDKTCYFSGYQLDQKLSKSSALQFKANIFMNAVNILVKNIDWDVKELHSLCCANQYGTVWKDSPVNDLLSYTKEKIPIMSSWTTSNILTVFFQSEDGVTIFSREFTSNDIFEEFNSEAVSFLNNVRPPEMVLYIAIQDDIFKNPELAHPDAMKGFYIHCQKGLEPTISLIVYQEFTADRLHPVNEFAMELASESVIGPELLENELIKKFLQLNSIES